MPAKKHPDTGQFISEEEYEKIMAERRKRSTSSTRKSKPEQPAPEPETEQVAPEPAVQREPHWDPRSYAPPGWDQRGQQPPRGVYPDDRPPELYVRRGHEVSGGYVNPRAADHYIPEPSQADGRYYDEPDEGSSLAGCLVVILFGLVLLLGGWLAWDKAIRPAIWPAPAPAPVPDIRPAPGLQSLTAPIAQKLSHQPEKARAVWKAYSGFSEALDGPSGERVENTRTFASVSQALLKDIDAGGGTPIGREIDEAVAEHLGIEWGRDDGEEGWEFKSFDDRDRDKLVEITAAIAAAAEGTL